MAKILDGDIDLKVPSGRFTNPIVRSPFLFSATFLLDILFIILREICSICFKDFLQISANDFVFKISLNDLIDI